MTSAKAGLDQIPLIRDFVAEIMMENGFDQREVLEAQLAVEEVCTNIILHAYEGRTGFLRVSVRVGEDRSRIIIEDDGPPFDPTKHTTFRSVSHDDTQVPVGGWGIELVRALMDEITYKRLHRKNLLCLVKKLGTRTPAV